MPVFLQSQCCKVIWFQNFLCKTCLFIYFWIFYFRDVSYSSLLQNVFRISKQEKHWFTVKMMFVLRILLLTCALSLTDAVSGKTKQKWKFLPPTVSLNGIKLFSHANIYISVFRWKPLRGKTVLLQEKVNLFWFCHIKLHFSKNVLIDTA